MDKRTGKKVSPKIDGKRKYGTAQPEYYLKKNANRSDLKREKEKQGKQP